MRQQRPSQRQLLLLLLLLLTAWWSVPSASHAQPFSEYCSHDALVCDNGGVVNMSVCQEWIVCNLDPPDHPLKMDLEEKYRCECPPEYRGTGCQLVVPNPGSRYGAEACERLTNESTTSNYTWDGTMLNLNQDGVKPVECFLDNIPSQTFFSIREHRVDLNITMHGGKATLDFAVISRHRNASNETHVLCWNALDDARCRWGDCTASTVDGKPTFECHSIDCTTCHTTHPDVCNNGAIAAFLQNPTLPATMQFADVDEAMGTAALTIETKLPLKLHCTTGVCTDTPINRNRHSPVNQEWIIILSVAGASGAMVLIVLASMYLNRRAAGEIGHWKKLLSPEHRSEMNNNPAVERMRAVLAQQLEDLPKFGILFDRVTYDVTLPAKCCRPRERKRILKGVSGVIQPCQLVAIIGSSGAGKSSLLDILADRAKVGDVNGYVGVISNTMQAHRRDVVAYVLQDDRMLTTGTVREILTFSARMRLPDTYTEAMIYFKVHQLMDDLGLLHIADSRVGSPDAGGGISGGERKRVAIGVELVANPRLLLLDEPTSGLDSYSAEVVMRVLRKAADNGCSCLLSIHQPPSRVFKLFDQVLVMTRRGQQAFFGKPVDAVDNFVRLGYEMPDKWMNPAEFLVEVASQRDLTELDRIARVFRSSERAQEIGEELDRILGSRAPSRRVSAVSVSLGDDRKSSNSQGGGDSPRLGVVVENPNASMHQVVSPQHSNSGGDDNDDNDHDDEGRGLDDEREQARKNRHDDVVTSTSGTINRRKKKKKKYKGNRSGTSPSAATSLVPPERSQRRKTSVVIGSGDDVAMPGGYLQLNDLHGAALPVFFHKQPSLLAKFVLLCGRSFQHVARKPSLLRAQLVVTVFVSTFIGVVFWHVDKTLTGIWNRTGVLFFVIVLFAMMSLSSMGTLFEERILFLRERAARMYSTLPYFVSTIVTDFVPLRVIPPMIFGSICYYMIGLNSEPVRFVTFLLVLVLVNVVSTAFCFAVSAFVSTVGQANLVASLFFIYSLLFGGLLLNNASETSFMVDLQYTSFFHYAYEALMVNEFVGLTLDFNPKVGTETRQVTIQGGVWLQNFGMSESNLSQDMWVLIVMFGILMIAAYTSLRFFQNTKK